jgi:hypothetical protein
MDLGRAWARRCSKRLLGHVRKNRDQLILDINPVNGG